MVSAVIVARMDSLIYKILFLVVNVSDACGDGDDGGYCYGDDDGDDDGDYGGGDKGGDGGQGNEGDDDGECDG